MISVIVPVYNVEKYLSRCIDSIVNQTYKDFEVVLFDDGSTDRSGKICDEYSTRYSNVKVIHSENGGLSNARNSGRVASKGEYITYIDSDDVISPDYLEVLINLNKKYDADVSCCEFNFFTNDSEIIFDSSNTIEKSLTGAEAAAQMLYGTLHGSSACAILMKRSIADSNEFTKGKYHEDDLVSFKFFLSANTVAVTSKRMYWYFQRPGSIMHSAYGQIALDEIDAADYIVDTCSNYDSSVIKASYVKKYSNYRDVLLTYPDIKTIDFETYIRIKKELKRTSQKIIRDNKALKRIRLSSFVCLFLGVKAMRLFYKKLGI